MQSPPAAENIEVRVPVLQFPGQSSFRPDAVQHAVALAPARLQQVLEEARDTLHRSLTEPTQSNQDVQLTVFLANHLHALALAEAGVNPTHSLGLSLGEYNHLVHIGAIAFPDALRLVDARGTAYDQGPAGAMAAFFPLPLDELLPLLEGTSATIATFNSPTQHVVAGSREDIAQLCERVEDETYANQRVIEPSIPMHHALFAPVAREFVAHLAAAPWQTPTAPYIANVLGSAAPEPDAAVSLLQRHVHEPVLWSECVTSVVEAHPGAVFIEAGPGQVLTNLGKRWVNRPHFHTADAEGLAQAASLGRPHGQ